MRLTEFATDRELARWRAGEPCLEVLPCLDVKQAVSETPMVVQIMRRCLVDKKVESLALCLNYETCHPSRKGRRQMEDLNGFARKWKDVLMKLTLSHTREGMDWADYSMEDLFSELLVLPVKQVREFYDLLLAELKGDQGVPFFIWKTVEHWKEQAVGVSQDVEAKMLQAELAGELAEMLEPALKPQLKQALADSLKWKSGETLGKIQAAVGAGHKLGLKGRESCLFLDVDGDQIML